MCVCVCTHVYVLVLVFLDVHFVYVYVCMHFCSHVLCNCCHYLQSYNHYINHCYLYHCCFRVGRIGKLKVWLAESSEDSAAEVTAKSQSGYSLINFNRNTSIFLAGVDDDHQVAFSIKDEISWCVQLQIPIKSNMFS